MWPQRNLYTCCKLPIHRRILTQAWKLLAEQLLTQFWNQGDDGRA